MYKVILVDDEKLTLDAIGKNMPWEEHGFRLTGAAENGREAVELIQQETPDLVITDICMPVMDGIELSAFIHKHYPQIKVVIISGYDDFEYAKQAIEYEVTNYLLKPVTSMELTEELVKIREKIRTSEQKRLEQEKIRTEYERNVPILRNHFLTRIVEGTYGKNDIAKQMYQLKIQLQGAKQAAVMLEVDDASSFVVEYEASDEDLVEAAVSNIAEEEVQNDPHILCFRNDLNKSVFILAQESEEQLEHFITEFAEQTIQLVQQYMGIKVCVLAGEAVSGIRNWEISYRSALSAGEHRMLFEGQTIIYGKEVEQYRGEGRGGFIRQVDQLVYEIKMHHREAIEREVRDLFESIRHSGKENKQLMVIVQNLVLMILMDLEEHLGDQNAYNKEAFIVALLELRYLSSIEQKFLEFCQDISDHIARRREGSNEKQAVRALDYIRRNFHNPQLSLQHVCDYLSVSSSYFSAIFKNATGETFVEVLTKIRIDRAKELLECTDMKNYEVALAVGYQDPHYFSSIFKKRVGMTPKEYSRQLRSEDVS